MNMSIESRPSTPSTAAASKCFFSICMWSRFILSSILKVKVKPREKPFFYHVWSVRVIRCFFMKSLISLSAILLHFQIRVSRRCWGSYYSWDLSCNKLSSIICIDSIICPKIISYEICSSSSRGKKNKHLNSLMFVTCRTSNADNDKPLYGVSITNHQSNAHTTQNPTTLGN